LTLFIDTSVWSLAFRRDTPSTSPEVQILAQAIERGETITTTGLVLQELLQGLAGPKARGMILDRFSALPMLMPSRDDHVMAADLRNDCRRRGIQIASIDALLAALCIRHDLTMLTSDNDFKRIAALAPLRLWHA
jgi:predicted nucleic acid-binding protein